MAGEVLLNALADKSRLKILASLTIRPKFVEELSLELNISVSTVSFHLKKLLSANLVVAKKVQYYQTYAIANNDLKKEFSTLLGSLAPDDNLYKQSVIKECFTNGRVVSLPVQFMKRQIVYQVIAEKFKKNKQYTEGEASLIIADCCEDFLTAKKEMLEFGFITKNKGKIIRK